MISGNSVWIRILGTSYHGAMAIDVAMRRGIGTIARTYISRFTGDLRESCRYRIAIIYLTRPVSRRFLNTNVSRIK